MSSDPYAAWIPKPFVRCNRAEINCTYSDGVVVADPEIAGIGVVIAFIVASFITFLAILVGYVTCSLDKELINGLDMIIIRRIRLLLCMDRRGDKLPYENDWEETRKTANESLTRFILALSDQQLVTGLAILITGYYQRCSISGYHFALVANLAWFSSITHLSTLAVLHKYFVDQPVLRACRVCGMVSVFGLLFHSQLYVQWYVIPSLPIQCTFDVGFPNLLSAAKYGTLGVLGANTWLGIIVFLLFSYGNALVQLFHSKNSSSKSQESASTGSDSKSSRATTVISWIDHLVRKKFEIPQLPSASKIFESEMTKLEAESPMPRFSDLTFSDLTFNNAAKFLFLRSRSHLILRFIMSEFVDSFAWDIVWMIFGNTFGFASVYETRWNTSPDPSLPGIFNSTVSGNENAMSFGQMTALLLMALPLLAAGEAYFDSRLKKSKDGHNATPPTEHNQAEQQTPGNSENPENPDNAHNEPKDFQLATTPTEHDQAEQQAPEHPDDPYNESKDDHNPTTLTEYDQAEQLPDDPYKDRRSGLIIFIVTVFTTAYLIFISIAAILYGDQPFFLGSLAPFIYLTGFLALYNIVGRVFAIRSAVLKKRKDESAMQTDVERHESDIKISRINGSGEEHEIEG